MEHLQPGTPLPFEACENFRELGGYAGLSGKTVKRGAFYRTPALANLQTPHDLALFKSLGVKTVIDFRSEPERLAAPDPAFAGIAHIDASAMIDADGNDVRFDLDEIFAQGEQGIYDMVTAVRESYAHMPFGNPAYRILFAQIAAGNTPLLFHCTAGKDRTGVAAALILKALGVSRADILRDYCLTNECRHNNRGSFMKMLAEKLPQVDTQALAQIVLGVEEENLVLVLDAIDARYPDFADYLREECAFDAAALAAMQAAYLE